MAKKSREKERKKKCNTIFLFGPNKSGRRIRSHIFRFCCALEPTGNYSLGHELQCRFRDGINDVPTKSKHAFEILCNTNEGGQWLLYIPKKKKKMISKKK